jgi:hypothetical protein
VYWIWHNKEWLFSGIGGTLILAVAGLIYRATRRRSVPVLASPNSSPSAPTRFTKPTSDEMMTEIAKLPPFQRDAAGEAYKGLKVCWLAEFLTIQKTNFSKSGDQDNRGGKNKDRKTGAKVNLDIPQPEEWLVTLGPYTRRSGFVPSVIYCYGISLEKYPQLKFLHVHAPVIVSGTVTSVRSVVNLKDVKLEFDSTGEWVMNRNEE